MAHGDTLVVVRLDRLARSLKHLLELIDRLRAVGAHLRSLRDPIDTSSPQGEFTLQILGAVAQLERSLISQRTKSALEAARKRGRIGGNPQLKARDPAALQRLSRTRAAARLFELNAGAQEGCRRCAICARTPRGTRLPAQSTPGYRRTAGGPPSV